MAAVTEDRYDELDELRAGRITLPFAGQPFPGPWTAAARCRNAPTSAFFPTQGDDTSLVADLCRPCPVRSECLDYALSIPGLRGIWGGTSEAERKRLRSQRPVTPSPGPARSSRTTRAPAGSLMAALEAVAARPGRWARIARFPSPHSASALASQLRTGRKPAPAGCWEFEGRVNDVGGSDLFARLIDPAEAGA